MEQDEELRGNTGRPANNSLTDMDHLTIQVNHAGSKFFFLMDFLLDTYCLKGKEREKKKTAEEKI